MWRSHRGHPQSSQQPDRINCRLRHPFLPNQILRTPKLLNPAEKKSLGQDPITSLNFSQCSSDSFSVFANKTNRASQRKEPCRPKVQYSVYRIVAPSFIPQLPLPPPPICLPIRTKVLPGQRLTMRMSTPDSNCSTDSGSSSLTYLYSLTAEIDQLVQQASHYRQLYVAFCIPPTTVRILTCP